MQKFNLYPSPVEGLAQGYYHKLFKGPASLATIYAVCTAEEEGVCILEVLDVLVEFFGRRHLITEETFYRIFTREHGNFLRILNCCADMDLDALQG